MNILKYLYAKTSMKRKILDIEEDIRSIIQPICKEKFWITWYGAYDIDPKFLVFWVCVESDKTKSKFNSNIKLIN